GMEPPTWTRRAVDTTVHETADPEVIVGEFAYEVTQADGTVNLVPCVFVMRVRDGEIVESRDYIDPIRAAQSRGALDDLITSLREA
ncbi:MAG: nuclear transport factor 2 family protein, partial [Micromonosporaceae bacterium]